MKNLIFVFFALLIACSPSKETKRDRFFMQGNDALANRNFDQAVDFYTLSIENDPQFANAYNNRGVAQMEDGHAAEAILDYNQAITIKPDFSDAIFNRAYAYEEVGNLSKALEDITTLEQMHPDSAYVHFYKGLLQTNTREYANGVTSFRRAIALDSSNLESYVNLATLYYFSGQLDSAKLWLKYVLKRNPEEANTYNTFCQVYLVEGDHQNALIAINKALQIIPREPYFLNNRGQVYLEMGDAEKALEDINASILTDPTNAWAYRNKGRYYLEKGQFDQAVRLLEDAANRTKFIDDLYSYLGEAYLGLKNNEKACEAWQKGMTSKEQRSQILWKKHCQ
jgi:tetratricopeptide (TPR) repeat protein